MYGYYLEKSIDIEIIHLIVKLKCKIIILDQLFSLYNFLAFNLPSLHILFEVVTSQREEPVRRYQCVISLK